MRTNKKTGSDHRFEKNTRLAGGFGAKAAKNSDEQTLRRLVLANLLWEDLAYIDGKSIANRIQDIVPKVDAQVVADLAVEVRTKQKLRHVPLLLAREMARHNSHKHLVADVLPKIIRRPDEMCELISMYWATNGGKKTLPASMKRGLANSFGKFDEYQLAKWDRDRDVRLRDVLFLCHAKAENAEQDALWKRLIDGTMKTPDTWEVGLSASKSKTDKKASWERLIEEGKLGAFALLKNLRNMQEHGVAPSVIRTAILTARPGMLLPLDFMKAQTYAPDYTRELEDLMFSCAEQYPKLKGRTIFVVDLSGSMGNSVSSKSQFTRFDVAYAMTVLGAEMCESVGIYATAGSDGARQHKTAKVKPVRGFGLIDELKSHRNRLGGGGIFTRQCLEYIRKEEIETPERIIILSDSQDCDYADRRVPNPFGKKNYIVDISAHEHGVNYDGIWTSEISGWSEHFLTFIGEMEAMDNLN